MKNVLPLSRFENKKDTNLVCYFQFFKFSFVLHYFPKQSGELLEPLLRAVKKFEIRLEACWIFKP